LNLDMRPSGFRFSKRIDDHACAQWVFSRFFGGTDPKFSKSLLLLYRGYYLSRPKDFRQALIDLGLLGSEQDPHELEGLLLDYFGQAGDAPIRFETLKFKQSFFSLFKYLKKNKRKVPSRLIWVGLALAGVYETLELLNAEFNVKDVFHKVDASIG
jgi:predicted unusual protein kinase regulating ubiquinone biosynthesis (AarF/ABC1/UbiB family)